MVCVILFIANRVTPAFRFCISNSTLTQVTPIRYYFLSFVTYHCNTYMQHYHMDIRDWTLTAECGILALGQNMLWMCIETLGHCGV